MLSLAEESTCERFTTNIRDIRAVEHGFLIISEAARTLPEDMTAAFPHIAWAAIKGFGNVLRHDYEQVDPNRLWVTLTTQLPELSEAVATLIKASTLES